jgi:D-alanine-D-alanine ligase-like ATP-grasp enzyme
LQSAEDLARYFRFIQDQVPLIPKGSFALQQEIIEMPSTTTVEYLLEPYIETDKILIQQGEIFHQIKEGWIELTIGVLEQKGNYRSLNPSITIAEGAVLSLEEKFQGGTGVNLTPPPEILLSLEAVSHIKHLIVKAAKALNIQNYARIDVFYHAQSKKMIVIEANTLPGLTPSTVFYHQGLAEPVPIKPLNLLELMITSKL